MRTEIFKSYKEEEKRAEQLSIRANCLLRNFREGKLTEQLALFV